MSGHEIDDGDVFDLAPDEGEGYDLAPAADEPPKKKAVGKSITCVKCSYDLKGMSPEGVCPECGTPVGRSLLDTSQLINASRDYLVKLHRGALIVTATIAVSVVLITIYIVAEAGQAAAALGLTDELAGWLYVVMDLLLSLAGLYGWWLLSAENPSYAGTDRGSKARVLLRGGLIGSAVMVAASAVALIIDMASPGSTEDVEMVVGLASMAAWVIRFFAAMVYLRWLSWRIPDQHVRDRATMLMWLGPLLMTVGLLLCGLGPVVALVLYWNLVDLVRRDVRRVINRQDRLGMA